MNNYKLSSIIAKVVYSINKSVPSILISSVTPLLSTEKTAYIAADFDEEYYRLQQLNSITKTINRTVDRIGFVGYINGTLVKDTRQCITCIQEIGTHNKLTDSNSRVVDIVLCIDIPDGTVDGILGLTRVIAQTMEPITVYPEDSISTTYWIASATDETFFNYELCEITSIGAMLSFADLQPYHKNLSARPYKTDTKHNKGNNHLNRDFKDRKYKEHASNSNHQKLIDKAKLYLKSINESFHVYKTYFSNQTIKCSLVEQVENLSGVIQSVAQ